MGYRNSLLETVSDLKRVWSGLYRLTRVPAEGGIHGVSPEDDLLTYRKYIQRLRLLADELEEQIDETYGEPAGKVCSITDSNGVPCELPKGHEGNHACLARSDERRLF